MYLHIARIIREGNKYTHMHTPLHSLCHPIIFSMTLTELTRSEQALMTTLTSCFGTEETEVHRSIVCKARNVRGRTNPTALLTSPHAWPLPQLLSISQYSYTQDYVFLPPCFKAQFKYIIKAPKMNFNDNNAYLKIIYTLVI